MVYCFTNTTTWGEWLKSRNGWPTALKRSWRGGGGFAFPSRSIYVGSRRKIDRKFLSSQQTNAKNRMIAQILKLRFIIIPAVKIPPNP